MTLVSFSKLYSEGPLFAWWDSHGSKVVRLHVYFEEYFFDDEAIHQLGRSEILQIPIPSDETYISVVSPNH